MGRNRAEGDRQTEGEDDGGEGKLEERDGGREGEEENER